MEGEREMKSIVAKQNILYITFLPIRMPKYMDSSDQAFEFDGIPQVQREQLFLSNLFPNQRSFTLRAALRNLYFLLSIIRTSSK
jgi:hypothetical protein